MKQRPATPERPWGWITAGTAIAVAAAALLTYVVVQAGEAEHATDPAAIEGISVHEYPGGQHTDGTVAYAESPPVGGPHDYLWADCTGTVYDIPIRPENAVHSLEHGAVWITYDPQRATADDISTLTDLVDGRPGAMLSPYPGLSQPISLQAWGHQLLVATAEDDRIEQFLGALTFNPYTTPEPGATCENPVFLDSPRPAAP